MREQQPLPTGVARQLSEKGACASGNKRRKAPKEMTSVKRNIPSNRIINKYYCENNILQIIGNRKRPPLGTKVILKFKIINKESEREDWQNPGVINFYFNRKQNSNTIIAKPLAWRTLVHTGFSTPNKKPNLCTSFQYQSHIH